MIIRDIKGQLHDKGVLAVLSHCQYMPTEEKLRTLADRYEGNESISAVACNGGGLVVGVIVVTPINGALWKC